MKTWPWLLGALLIVACGDDATDDGVGDDTAPDAAITDGGGEVADAGGADAGAPVDAGPQVTAAIVYDFAAGDSMGDAREGFRWHSDRSVSTAEGSSEAGAEFAHRASPPGGDSTSEVRYSFPQTLDLYQRMRLQVPTNFVHRTSLRLTLAPGTSVAGWELGDTIVGSDGMARGTLLFIAEDETRIWLDDADDPRLDRAWLGTATNETRGETFVVADRFNEGSNNKLWAIWMDGYSGGGWGPTVIWEFWPDGSGGSELAVHWSRGEHTGAGSHRMGTPFFVVPEDRGTFFDITTRVVAATSRGSNDGVIQLWVRKAGESEPTLIHDVRDADIAPPVEEPDDDELPRQWANGYLMGWSNSGYAERTVFRLSRYEYWGSERPPDLPAE